MKLGKNGRSFFVTLPKQIVLAKQWQVGDALQAVITKEGHILIKEK